MERIRSTRARRKSANGEARPSLPSETIDIRLYPTRCIRRRFPVNHIEGSGPALATVAHARPLHAEIERIARVLEAAAEGDFRGHVRLDVQHPLARVGAAADHSIAR